MTIEEVRNRLTVHEWDYWQARAVEYGCLGWQDYNAAFQTWLLATQYLKEPGSMTDYLPFRKAQRLNHPSWEQAMADLDAIAIRLPRGE